MVLFPPMKLGAGRIPALLHCPDDGHTGRHDNSKRKLAESTMKTDQLIPDQRVRVADRVEVFGGKKGEVVDTGSQLGYRVVRVRFPGESEPVVFAPNEVIPL
jgi:hypothetical protein